MDLKALNYFIAVYENESFSGAAKHCFIAQPSISSAIAQLEQELNVALFIRHARGVKPTLDSEKLYPLAKQLVGQANAISASFKQNTDKPEFHLGVTKGLGVKRMSALLKEFTNAEPDIALTLVSPEEASDARIITKEELQPDEHFHPIWQEDYLLAIPESHPLSLEKHISLSKLEQLPMIKRSPCQAWQKLEEALTLKGMSLDIRAQIQTIDYALGLVSAGVGCALLPAYQEVLEHKDIRFKSITELQLNREIVLAYRISSPVIDTLKIITTPN